MKMPARLPQSPLESSGKPLFFRVESLPQFAALAPRHSNGVAIRTWGRSLSTMQKEAIVASSRDGGAWRLASDEGAYLMGDDIAPCPLSFLTTGMVASFMSEILTLARERGTRFRDIRLVQDNFYTMAGSALRGTMTGGALPVELAVEIDTDTDSRLLSKMVHDAIEASAATGLIRGELTSLFTLTHNGREIENGRAVRLRRPAEPDLGNRFDAAQPAEGDWKNLIVRNGMSPRTSETTGGTGSSLAEEQNRKLHVRGICTLGPAGVKKIEQHLYNPQGSIFHFLSDEAREAGGESRAPDAATYMSAGIAFCFMTQFGRYAKIVKKDLQEYRVVQDTHFSRGHADPVETHVHLVTNEDETFSRTILDVAEQTCFLHALCRTALAVNVGLHRP